MGSCVGVAALLCGCGGGDPGSGGGGAALTSPSTNVSVAEPGAARAQCGVDAGPYVLTGAVTSVHDGDTITVASPTAGAVSVRLDSIDAPELVQPYGAQSRNALVAAVLGRQVTVTYAKSDQYGRIVGAVFSDSCLYVNLDLVRAGLAWYYKAYQCEISADTRNLFARAQADASQAGLGLWSQPSAEAPWFYRNGTEPTTPACTSATAAWANVSALSSTTATVTPGTAFTTTPLLPPAGSTSTSTAPVCYVGPRGGTYTLTASGKKNYGGC